MLKVTAIFDIGKTNKKFFLFDESFQEVYRAYEKFDPILDEEGHESDDLNAIQTWVKSIFDQILSAKKYDVRAINFSTYGASLVHIDRDGNPLTPLYNYTKSLEKEVYQSLLTKYGGAEKLSLETASPDSGMLCSGLQLYWLKKTRPLLFREIAYSLHLPQYLSYLFTGIPLSDFTSIGCHTMLWDYQREDYHRWVKEEGLLEKLAPIVDANVSINMNYLGKKIKIGVGIHDSSAALLPYLKGARKSFTLISTGTWSIALNPFVKKSLTEEDLSHDCLNYLQVDGNIVRANRLFLGQEYKEQVQRLQKFFQKPKNYHKSVSFDPELYQNAARRSPFFDFNHLQLELPSNKKTDLDKLIDFESAYHQLMYELLQIQIRALKRIDVDQTKYIYVDGGFVGNELYIEGLCQAFPNKKIMTSESALGSALGAAMVISESEIGKKFLKKKYRVKKHRPLILSKFGNEQE